MNVCQLHGQGMAQFSHQKTASLRKDHGTPSYFVPSRNQPPHPPYRDILEQYNNVTPLLLLGKNISQTPRSSLSEQCKELITKTIGAHPCHAPLATTFCFRAKKRFFCFDEMTICNGKNSKTCSPQGPTGSKS